MKLLVLGQFGPHPLSHQWLHLNRIQLSETLSNFLGMGTQTIHQIQACHQLHQKFYLSFTLCPSLKLQKDPL